MKKAHLGRPKALSDSIVRVNKDKKNKEKIDRLIKKSRELDKKKNVFETILDNFFRYIFLFYLNYLLGLSTAIKLSFSSIRKIREL